MFLKKPVWQLASAAGFRCRKKAEALWSFRPGRELRSLRFIPGNRRPSNWEEEAELLVSTDPLQGEIPQSQGVHSGQKQFSVPPDNALWKDGYSPGFQHQKKKIFFSKSKTKKETSLPTKWISRFEKKINQEIEAYSSWSEGCSGSEAPCGARDAALGQGLATQPEDPSWMLWRTNS